MRNSILPWSTHAKISLKSDINYAKSGQSCHSITDQTLFNLFNILASVASCGNMVHGWSTRSVKMLIFIRCLLLRNSLIFNFISHPVTAVAYSPLPEPWVLLGLNALSSPMPSSLLPMAQDPPPTHPGAPAMLVSSSPQLYPWVPLNWVPVPGEVPNSWGWSCPPVPPHCPAPWQGDHVLHPPEPLPPPDPREPPPLMAPWLLFIVKQHHEVCFFFPSPNLFYEIHTEITYK